jgi:hypothetical protein
VSGGPTSPCRQRVWDDLALGVVVRGQGSGEWRRGAVGPSAHARGHGPPQAWRWAVLALGAHVTSGAQRMCRHPRGPWIQGDSTAGGLRRGSLAWRGRLCAPEALRAVVGAVAPRQRRDVQPLCRAAMPAVPAAGKARGLLPTLGYATGIEPQGLGMRRRPHRRDRRLGARDKVTVAGGPTGTGALVRRAVAAPLSHRGMPWEPQEPSQQRRNKFVWWFLGWAHTRPSTLSQSQGVPPFSVVSDNTTRD